MELNCRDGLGNASGHAGFFQVGVSLERMKCDLERTVTTDLMSKGVMESEL